MRDKTYLKALLDWNKWANEETYEMVSQLPPEEVYKKRKTLLESIFVSLHHMLNVDDIWLHHMQSKKHDYEGVRVTRIEDLETLREQRIVMDAKLSEYLDSLTEEQLEEVVDYELVCGRTGSMSRAFCITHLVLHGSYHRGWISDMFGQADATQPTTDLPVFERALRSQGLALPQ